MKLELGEKAKQMDTEEFLLEVQMLHYMHQAGEDMARWLLKAKWAYLAEQGV